MVFRNHIAYRFMTDFRFTLEMVEAVYPEEYKLYVKTKPSSFGVENMPDKLIQFIDLIQPEDSKTYYIADTVISKLDLLKVYPKENGHFDWTIFNNKVMKYRKYTFILPDQRLLRIRQTPGHVDLYWLEFEKAAAPGKNIDGTAYQIMLYYDCDNGALCTHFDHPDGKRVEPFIYKLLCFFFLTENEEEIIQPGQVKGTRNTGKVSNDFKFPVTMVNSKWNITTIRLDGFTVSGHFRLQPYGEGLSLRKIIFIDPFEKKGYKRVAKKVNET